MNGHRRAAVALHGLHAKDRQAMLAQLPPQDQQILRGYLDELATLGFSGAPELMQAPMQQANQPGATSLADSGTNSAVRAAGAAPGVIMAGMQATVPGANQPGPNLAAAQDQLRRASVAALLSCLRDEPPLLIARILMQERWPWQEALLAQLPAQTRAQVRAKMAQTLPVANQLQALLLTVLLQKLLALPLPTATVPANSSWLDGWRRRWKR